MPDPLDVFAANLRRIRVRCGLSQERLAHSADLNMTHVAKIERSEREPGVRTVSKLAIALRISASELFDGIDGRHDDSEPRPQPTPERRRSSVHFPGRQQNRN